MIGAARSLAILASDVDCGVAGQVVYKVPIAKLIDSLFHRHDLEWAQGLCVLELLHVQGPML